MGFGILFTGLLNMTAAVAPLSESETFARLFIQMADVPVLWISGGNGGCLPHSEFIRNHRYFAGTVCYRCPDLQFRLCDYHRCQYGRLHYDRNRLFHRFKGGREADRSHSYFLQYIRFYFSHCRCYDSSRCIGALDGIWNARITSGGIANAHTLFRLFAAIVLLPVSLQFEKLAKFVIKDNKYPEEDIDAEIQQLDEKLFASPALALSSISGVISENGFSCRFRSKGFNQNHSAL